LQVLKKTSNDTINTQPALFVHSLSATRVLNETILTSYLHSLPGIQWVAKAGWLLLRLSFADGLLVQDQGELMKRPEKFHRGMAAILGLDISVLEQICADAVIHRHC
jgi:malonyl CoA-acyl carrier protein transacylase